jgi:hypothetical protein
MNPFDFYQRCWEAYLDFWFPGSRVTKRERNIIHVRFGR